MIVTAGSVLSLAVLYLIAGLLVANVTAGPSVHDSHGLRVALVWPMLLVALLVLALAPSDAIDWGDER